VTKVSDLIGEISAAATEQAGGISQINQGLSQIDQVTQQNTANAEESAAAAEELSGQVQQMHRMLQRFHLRGGATVRAGLPSPVAPTPNAARAGGQTSSSAWGGAPAASQTSGQGKSQRTIALDDEEFGRY
jgi:methyl-accepting chemotaxis protein